MSETKTATTTVDLTKVKPYGDTLNDGKVEMAFTLPVPYGEEAEECAKQYVKKLGFNEPNVTYYHELGPGYTFFVVYGSAQQTIDSPQFTFQRLRVMYLTELNAENGLEKTSAETSW